MSRPPFSRGRPAPVIVLPDTSVWGSFLREGAHGRVAALDGLLAGQQVVACRPVVAEILAGARDVQRSELRTLWSSLPRADLGRRQWQHVGDLAARARRWRSRTWRSEWRRSQPRPSCGAGTVTSTGSY